MFFISRNFNIIQSPLRTCLKFVFDDENDSFFAETRLENPILLRNRAPTPFLVELNEGFRNEVSAKKGHFQPEV